MLTLLTTRIYTLSYTYIYYAIPYHNMVDFSVPPAAGLNLLIALLTTMAIVGAAIGLSFVPWQSLFARIRQAFEPRDNALNENPMPPVVGSICMPPTIIIEPYVLPHDAPGHNAFNDMDSTFIPTATLVQDPDHRSHEEASDLPCEEDLEDYVPPFCHR